MRFDKSQSYVKELYDLDKTRRKVKEEIRKQQLQDEEEQLKELDFKPKINQKSDQIAKKMPKNKPDVITR